MGMLRVAVIGAGVVGASTAQALATRGADVLVFDQGAPGQGSTARSVGGIRTFFRHRLETEMSLYSLDAFHKLARDSGGSFELQQKGYLLLTSNADGLAKQDVAIAEARGLGADVRECDPAEVNRLIPGIRTNDVVRGLLCPRDCYIRNPEATAEAYLRLAAATGRATLFDNTYIDEAVPDSAGFKVRSGTREWRADAVVVALNAHAQPLLRKLGVRLASHPYPRHVFSISPPAGFDPDMPMTVFQDSDMLFRFDGDRITNITGVPTKSSTDCSGGNATLPVAAARIAERVDLSRSEVKHAWTGLRAMTPDRRALVGKIPGVTNAWCAIGFSGHGFMHAPATALAVSELVLDGASRTFDISPLDPARFGDVAETPPILQPSHH